VEDLQRDTYRFPPAAPGKRYRAVNASQMIVAYASVFHFENISARGRFTVLARVPHGALHAVRRRVRAQRRQLQAAGRPVDKLNTAALGNVTRQLHVHVVGRRRDDGLWPDPIWGRPGARPLSADDKAALLRAIREA
jgi:hypothetical protein